jgi:hypothetical protein
VKTIAEDKMPDLNAFTVSSAMKMVAGTARSMGITVKGEFPHFKLNTSDIAMAKLTKKQKIALEKIRAW